MNVAADTTIVMEDVPGSRLMPEDLVRLPPLESWRLERSFSQRLPLHRMERSLTLFNGHFLELREKRRGRQRRAVFNLAFVNPEPLEKRFVAVRWLAGAAAFGLLAAALLWGGWLLAAALAGASAILLVMQGGRRSHHRTIFYTAEGRAPLFSLELGWVAGRDCKAFAELIGERAQGSSTLLPDGRERLAVEVAELRRLHECGALSRRHYDVARKRIFARFGKHGGVSALR